jgi:spermidine/putrescine-binding protein
VQIHDLLHDGHAEPGARRLGGEERLEDPVASLGRDPDAIIDHFHGGAVALDEEVDLDASAAPARLDGLERVPHDVGEDLAQLLAVGEFPLAISYTHTVEWSKSQGSSVDWVNLEPVIIKFDGIMLGAKAAHPNAAKLFIDFVLSQTGQELLQSFSRVTLRSGVEPNPPRLIKGFKRVVLHPDKSKDAQESLKLYREIFALP